MMERFTDAALPIEQRLAEIEALAARGDLASARTLMALGARDTQLNAAAIAALGRWRTAGVAAYLKARLSSGDPRVLAAAVRSLAQVAGADAVAPIAEVLRRNRRREDGFEDTVCGACVEALGAIGAPAAMPALTAELDETVGRELQYDYGSQVVDALARIGNADARPALLAYDKRLRAERVRQADNPLAARYLDEKLAEIARAMDILSRIK